MSDPRPEPVVKRSADIEYEAAGAADETSKGVLISEANDAPNLAIRRSVLNPGTPVPKHTDEVGHEQYALSGHYVVGVGDEEYEAEAEDSLLIPAGVVHWYRSESDAGGAFLCAVPSGDDAIELAADVSA